METLANFVVGIGTDTKDLDKGIKTSQDKVGAFASDLLSVGSKIAGAFIGATGAVAGITKSVADTQLALKNFGSVHGVAGGTLQALGYVFEQTGGQADDAKNALSSLDEKRAKLQKGDTSWIPEAALAGLDTKKLTDTADAYQMLLELSRQMSQMPRENQLLAGKAFGLDDAGIALMQRGPEVIDNLVAKYDSLRPSSARMQEDAANLTQKMTELQAAIGHVGDEIFNNFSPAMSEGIDSMTAFMDKAEKYLKSPKNKITFTKEQATTENPLAAAMLGTGYASAVKAAKGESTPVTTAGTSFGAQPAGGPQPSFNFKTISEQMKEKGTYSSNELPVPGTNLTSVSSVNSAELPTPLTSDTVAPGPITPVQVAAVNPINNNYVIQRQDPAKITITPTPVTLALDGNVIDKKMMEFMYQQNNAAYDDLQSTTDR